jgi:hypothetical protein
MVCKSLGFYDQFSLGLLVMYTDPYWAFSFLFICNTSISGHSFFGRIYGHFYLLVLFNVGYIQSNGHFLFVMGISF